MPSLTYVREYRMVQAGPREETLQRVGRMSSVWIASDDGVFEAGAQDRTTARLYSRVKPKRLCVFSRFQDVFTATHRMVKSIHKGWAPKMGQWMTLLVKWLDSELARRYGCVNSHATEVRGRW
jgi:hypothetical protein